MTPQNQCDRPVDWLEGPVSLHLIPQGRPSARPAALISVCVCAWMCACMCVFLHLIPQDRPKAMGWGISAVTGGQASMCVCVSMRELECEHYSTVVQLDCRVPMYFYRTQSCVEVVVGF